MLRQRFGFGSKGMETGTDVGLAALCSGVISPLQLASLELFDHLASQRMRFPPAQVNDPCRSHIHPATPRVVGQPSETVLYRELQGPRPRDAALFVYVARRQPRDAEPDSLSYPRLAAPYVVPGRALRLCPLHLVLIAARRFMLDLARHTLGSLYEQLASGFCELVTNRTIPTATSD